MRGLLLLNQAGKENIVADIKTFQKEIGYQFQNEHLLVQALTHSSYANEKKTGNYKDNALFASRHLRCVRKQFISGIICILAMVRI